MKNYFYSSIIALLCVFSSCSKSENKPDESDIGGGGYVSGTYWPYAINNAWSLVNPENPEDKSEYIIHKTTTYDGKTYFQFKPVGIDVDIEQSIGFREDKGVFIEYHGAMKSMDVNTSAGTMTSINTNLNVNEPWTDVMTLTISGAASGTIKHTNKGKILEKANRVTINGKEYKDVLKTELKKSVFNSLTGVTIDMTYERWLAKGIGIIYEKNTYDDLFSERYHLVNYRIK